MKADPRTNVFIDPQGYRDFVRASRAEFETALASSTREKGGG